MHLTDADLANWLKLLAAVAAFITITFVPAFLTIWNTIRNGQAQRAGQAAITAEQQNRYLASRNADPVTMQSPPMGTGDGRIDKAVMKQLAVAPTSPSTVPSVDPAPPVVPVPPPDPPRG